MKIQSLIIKRNENYDPHYPGQIVGVVQTFGARGKVELKLSPAVVANIFKLIQKDAQDAADYNASQVGQAVKDAAGEQALIEVSEGVSVGFDDSAAF